MFSTIERLTIFTNRQDYQESHAGALQAGLAAHGIKTSVVRTAFPPGRVRDRHVACWGWRPGRMLQKMGHDVLVMERGYISAPGDPERRRFDWTSLGWNGLNGRAKRYTTETNPERFARNFGGLMQPWKSGGDYVLLIGQVPGDASLGGMDLGRWYEETAQAAHKAYGLPVRFRAHPVAIKRGHRRTLRYAKALEVPAAAAFAGAAVVVTFNSNTAVESVLAGVPTVTLDMGSMARDVTAHKIGDITRPDRSEWAARLAWCQFELAEIRSGFAWEHVRPTVADKEAA